jgi:hypothetical protein
LLRIIVEFLSILLSISGSSSMLWWWSWRWHCTKRFGNTDIKIRMIFSRLSGYFMQLANGRKAAERRAYYISLIVESHAMPCSIGFWKNKRTSFALLV